MRFTMIKVSQTTKSTIAALFGQLRRTDIVLLLMEFFGCM
jgi:hypothetical protein